MSVPLLRIQTRQDKDILTRSNPALGKLIGRDEADLLYQIDYWIFTQKRLKDGRYWARISLDEMREKGFESMTRSKLWRLLQKLQALGLIDVTQHYNSSRWDKTNWYAINGDALNQYSVVEYAEEETSASVENRRSMAETPISRIRDINNKDSKKEEKAVAPTRSHSKVTYPQDKQFWEFAHTLADLLYMDFELNKKDILDTAARLWNEEYRATDLEAIPDYWLTQEWRGKRDGGFPSLKAVCEIIRAVQDWDGKGRPRDFGYKSNYIPDYIER
jgi:hypothetical protein